MEDHRKPENYTSTLMSRSAGLGAHLRGQNKSNLLRMFGDLVRLHRLQITLELLSEVKPEDPESRVIMWSPTYFMFLFAVCYF